MTLSDPKRALLEHVLRQRSRDMLGIPRLAASGPQPCSYGQERLWFLDQLAPGSSAYNMFAGLRLSGVLHVPALELSLSEIVRRHEVLRTRFQAPEGRPQQVIGPPQKVPLRAIDLGDMPADQRDREVGRLAEEEARRPFDLAVDLMLRASLVRIAPLEHVLLLTMHHIASDGWSLGLFVGELAKLYRAFAAQQAPSLPELPIQYADFARWEREWLERDVVKHQLTFWKKQLAGLAPMLELPADRPRPPVQSGAGARCPVVVPAELSTALKELCQGQGVTPFMGLLALFQAVLSRHSGQTDIAVGTPVATRRRDTENLIGLFVKTLVLRSDLSGEPTFRALLARTKEVTLASFQHQELPFERLVEELRPQRSMSHHPLFQVMFVLQNAPFQPLELGGLRIEFLPIDSGTSKFDLLLSLDDLDGKFVGHLEYSTDLFDPSTVARMAEHFVGLLAAAVAAPDVPVASLPFLSEAEQRLVLRAWNQPSSAAEKSCAVHRLFEAQVERTPDATALVFAADTPVTMTYRELQRRAHQLARHLARLGVGPDVPVGISVERSPEMVVAVLGVLAAGGTCVPLDPAYPSQRLAFMLEDTSAPVLLSLRRMTGELPPHRARVVYLDEWDEIARESDAPPEAAPHPDHIAYIIYTSGSTGRPKGIALPHRALTNLIEWHVQTMVTGAPTLQFASLSFDASFHEILAALATGGAVHVISEGLRRDPPALARYIDQAGIAKIIVPVVVLQQMAEEMADADGTFARLREITTTGEQLQITRPIVRLFQRCSHIRFHNHYGPSETHVVTALELGGAPAEWPMHPSIGHAIRATQIYVLDRHLRPVPLGVIGELYIGGVMLARGYHGRPGLTAERFVPDPFAEQPGGRLYRTGDLARLRPDGQITFIGRTDHQVKIRGFRIEPGEVEAVLGQHPGLREAFVVARDDGAGNRLVGYVVADATPEPTVSELREFLGRQLPAHMIPSAFVMLDTLPLTPNGKIDRRALPAPEAVRPVLEGSYVAPRTETERLIVEIWQRTLRVDKVGVDDSFFELGGHSLLAVQLATRVRVATRIDVPLRILFESPTVAAMAEAVDRGSALGDEVAASSVSAIPRRADRDQFPASFNQAANWRFWKRFPDSRFNHIGAALILDGPLDREALERAIADIFARHEVLRARFAMVDDRLVHVIAPPAPVTLPVLDLSDLPEAQRDARVREWARTEGLRPFDLGADPPLRVALAKLYGGRHALAFVVHHMVFDGFSAAIFFRELGVFYRAHTTGRRAELPPLAFDYSDFAEWQTKHAVSPAGEADRAWWTRYLQGLTAVPLPTRVPPPVALSPSRSQSVSTELDPAIFEMLCQLRARERVTLLLPMLAAFMATLHVVSDHEDISVGNSYVGRDQAGATGVIGFFTHPIVVRARIEAALKLREVLARVRGVVLEARTHQATHLGLVSGVADAYRINFNFLPPPPVPALPGVRTAEIVPLDHGETMFDLAAFVQARERSASVHLVYRDGLFTRDDVVKIRDLYMHVLSAMASDPELTVGELRHGRGAKR